MGGPSFYPTLPREVLEGQSRPGEGWGKSDDREQSRRSIYIFAKRSLAVPELEILDAPDTTSSCERRMVSTTGPQALTFLNGAFMYEQARHFAARLVAEVGQTPKDQVERAFELALGSASAARGVAGRARIPRQATAADPKPMHKCESRMPISCGPAQSPGGVLPGRPEHERVRL